MRMVGEAAIATRYSKTDSMRLGKPHVLKDFFDANSTYRGQFTAASLRWSEVAEVASPEETEPRTDFAAVN
ncbi:MAG: hypothetical protein Aurels2KO_39530 [Aureliella sp.]